MKKIIKIPDLIESALMNAVSAGIFYNFFSLSIYYLLEPNTEK